MPRVRHGFENGEEARLEAKRLNSKNKFYARWWWMPETFLGPRAPKESHEREGTDIRDSPHRVVPRAEFDGFMLTPRGMWKIRLYRTIRVVSAGVAALGGLLMAIVALAVVGDLVLSSTLRGDYHPGLTGLLVGYILGASGWVYLYFEPNGKWEPRDPGQRLGSFEAIPTDEWNEYFNSWDIR